MTGEEYNIIAQNLSSALDYGNISDALAVVKELNVNDTVQFITTASADQRERLILMLNRFLNPEVLVNLNEDVLVDVINYLGLERLVEITSKLDVDEVLSIAEVLCEEERQEFLDLLPDTRREVLIEILSYPEESAGRWVHKDFIMVPKYWKIGQAVDLLRLYSKLPEHIQQIFIVGDDMQLVGTISLEKLVLNKPNIAIHDIMDTEFHAIDVKTDQEEAANIFQNNNLSLAPIVDEGRMIGVMPFEDVVEIVRQETEEDTFLISGVSDGDVNLSILQTTKQRLPWLLATLVTSNASSFIIQLFGNTLSFSIAVSILMPIAASMSGNAGTQSIAIAVRAMATGELTSINSSRLLTKELLVGAITGVILATFATAFMFARLHHTIPQGEIVKMSVTFLVSIILSLTMSNFIGAGIPILLRKLKLDPAIGSGILLTAATDSFAYFIFLWLVWRFFI